MKGRGNRAQREAGWSEGLGKGPIESLSVGFSNAFKKDVVERKQGREGASVSCLHPSMDHFLSVWTCLCQKLVSAPLICRRPCPALVTLLLYSCTIVRGVASLSPSPLPPTPPHHTQCELAPGIL